MSIELTPARVSSSSPVAIRASWQSELSSRYVQGIQLCGAVDSSTRFGSGVTASRLPSTFIPAGVEGCAGGPLVVDDGWVECGTVPAWSSVSALLEGCVSDGWLSLCWRALMVGESDEVLECAVVTLSGEVEVKEEAEEEEEEERRGESGACRWGGLRGNCE